MSLLRVLLQYAVVWICMHKYDVATVSRVFIPLAYGRNSRTDVS